MDWVSRVCAGVWGSFHVLLVALQIGVRSLRAHPPMILSSILDCSLHVRLLPSSGDRVPGRGGQGQGECKGKGQRMGQAKGAKGSRCGGGGGGQGGAGRRLAREGGRARPAIAPVSCR